MSAKTRPRASPVGTLSGRNPEVVAAGEKMSKHHYAIDAGEGVTRYNRDTASLDRFLDQPKWEISAQTKCDEFSNRLSLPGNIRSKNAGVVISKSDSRKLTPREI